MYKVFFKERIIFLGDQEQSRNCNGIVRRWNSGDHIMGWLQEFENDENCSLLFLYSCDVEALFQAFKSCFCYIEAAGGWVWNSKDEFLAIYRLGKWDLPKGKVEKNEKILQAAFREVEEECGVHGMSMESVLPSTYHTYWMKGKWMLKQTYWFEMKYGGDETLVPQTQEDIVKAVWMSVDKLADFGSSTYDSLVEIVREIASRRGIALELTD